MVLLSRKAIFVCHGGNTMDFEKIYADFEAARAVYDLERMSEIITQVNIYCSGLAANGRGNEIPQSAVHIANHIKVLIYHALELLSAGNGARAKYYMVSLAQDDLSGFDRFFNLHTRSDFLHDGRLFERGKNFQPLRKYPCAEMARR